ncbi:SAV_6107 family HEPN domain-containing protein [Phaeacidiphilus oryzae]|jgi:hypothetical protein|uniref:SAV_6107 family HEPN domain-containing protein n=1 Tax=Phaeacidiphilus oryzae TaxID=348818 RepID=UPI00068DE577|nr:SAV_6107 family HEPN domain-containing protein [Phaeacidiphilus oryzae]
MTVSIQPKARVLQLPLQAQDSASGARGASLPQRPPGDIHPVPRRSAAPPAALDLLAQAERSLAEARGQEQPLERYAIAHLAALRATAAVLAVRGRPEKTDARGRRRIRSAWDVLPEVAPELAEWSAYYAAGAGKRAAAEAGIESAATMRDADDLIRNTALYLRIVQRLLSLRPQVAPPAQLFDEPEEPPEVPRTG